MNFLVVKCEQEVDGPLEIREVRRLRFYGCSLELKLGVFFCLISDALKAAVFGLFRDHALIRILNIMGNFEPIQQQLSSWNSTS